MASDTYLGLMEPGFGTSGINPIEECELPSLLLREPCYLEVLIPARNEAQRLPRTLLHTIEYLEAQPYPSSVVVIDNGSVDQTADLVATMSSELVPVHLMGCARPGKGAAVRRGFLSSRAQFIGYMDADLATPIETLDVVMPLLRQGYAVIGSRRVSGATLTRRRCAHRAIGGAVFRAMANRVWHGVSDTQCGFKFFPGEMARMAARNLTTDGFAFDVELLRSIAGMDVGIREIPVTWSDGVGSTFRAVRDGARAVADLYRLARRGVA